MTSRAPATTPRPIIAKNPLTFDPDRSMVSSVEGMNVSARTICEVGTKRILESIVGFVESGAEGSFVEYDGVVAAVVSSSRMDLRGFSGPKIV